MQRWKFLATLLALWVALPYALLMAAGCVWLYQQGLLLYFLAATAVISWATRGWFRYLFARTERRWRIRAGVDPIETWPPAGKAAWQEVQAIAEKAQQAPPPIDQPERWWQLLREVFVAVAKEFHPKSDQPGLEVPLPDALAIVEFVSRDLRIALRERVPGSHILTINDFNRGKRLWGRLEQVYHLYRVAYLGFNPAGAIVREIRDNATGQMMTHSVEGIHRWATAYCVSRAGLYAIQLYTGQVKVDDEAFQKYTTGDSRQAAGDAGQRQEQLAGEPLRILVIGQTKAGKSSLINALFGEVRAATDVIPRTAGVEPFVLEREGLPRAIILDTAGYSAVTSETPKELKEALLKTDLILLVCSARSAAREPDRAMLADLHERFAEDRHRSLPPVIGVLAHIDSLRPLNDWSPPFNLLSPDTPKAQSIATAVQVVASELSLPEDHVVPVCLLPERCYNVEDGLMPAMLAVLPSAQRAKLLRTLKQFRDEEVWQLLWHQAVNTGRLLVRTGGSWGAKRAEELASRISGR